ncbi:hypothetical protein LNO75_03585 [Mycoplasma sp. T363T]|uniref:Uncharacterized protein n=2 Tax=Mycoplasma bradburyae TaxID=2963128 RepID=A0ABT5GBR7_9MOLU|nr:hypothetical protein [Mycoplasma bradburyae]MDC4163641.1 hypothetical protein [Mycoplasma bradburyae]MDC4182249.1 hypothetical protein [Mycoplasma bradburyae]UTS70470.1 hypothetical protein NMG68_01890 [Mycoplasma bradburyae]
MNTNKFINSIIAGLMVAIITFLAIMFLVKINIYESYPFRKFENTLYINFDKKSELANFIDKTKPKYLIGYYKNNPDSMIFNIIEISDQNSISLEANSINQNIGTLSFYLGKSRLYQHLIKSVNL